MFLHLATLNSASTSVTALEGVVSVENKRRAPSDVRKVRWDAFGAQELMPGFITLGHYLVAVLMQADSHRYMLASICDHHTKRSSDACRYRIPMEMLGDKRWSFPSKAWGGILVVGLMAVDALLDFASTASGGT